MSDLVEFLRARLDEDERAAKDAPQSAWSDEYGEFRSRGGELFGHVLRHDPARVLREVHAKRKLLGSHYNYDGLCPRCFDFSNKPVQREAWPCEVVRLLALPYADHPDYHEEWKL